METKIAVELVKDIAMDTVTVFVTKRVFRYDSVIKYSISEDGVKREVAEGHQKCHYAKVPIEAIPKYIKSLNDKFDFMEEELQKEKNRVTEQLENMSRVMVLLENHIHPDQRKKEDQPEPPPLPSQYDGPIKNS